LVPAGSALHDLQQGQGVADLRFGEAGLTEAEVRHALTLLKIMQR
jgi:hypothetical protein